MRKIYNKYITKFFMDRWKIGLVIFFVLIFLVGLIYFGGKLTGKISEDLETSNNSFVPSSSGSFTQFLENSHDSIYSVNQVLEFEIVKSYENVSESITEIIKEGHSMRVEEIKENFVILIFMNSQIKIELFVGDSINLDIDNDGKIDINVKLESIFNNKAHIILVPLIEEK